MLVLCETQASAARSAKGKRTSPGTVGWVDKTRLVDDSLSLNFHDMGTFLISEIRGVRLADSPRSEARYDRLEFRDMVRG
jgi:hypothetical protein